MAVEASSFIVILQQAGFLYYLISCDGGNRWAYFDNISLAKSISGVVSSPSIKIYNNNLFLFYIDNTSDLYLKKIYFGRLTSLYSQCIGRRSSSMQDSIFINLKNELQNYLDNSCKSIFVSQINDQQVAFDIEKNSSLHVVYQDTRGNIKSIFSNDYGSTWNQNPINL